MFLIRRRFWVIGGDLICFLLIFDDTPGYKLVVGNAV